MGGKLNKAENSFSWRREKKNANGDFQAVEPTPKYKLYDYNMRRKFYYLISLEVIVTTIDLEASVSSHSSIPECRSLVRQKIREVFVLLSSFEI